MTIYSKISDNGKMFGLSWLNGNNRHLRNKKNKFIQYFRGKKSNQKEVLVVKQLRSGSGIKELI